MHTISEKRIRMLKPRDIKRSENPIRTVQDEYELSLLRDSISASGILQPIIVRKIKKGSYQLVSGERRLAAAIMAGLRRVPCVVHNVGDTTALIYSLAENLQSLKLSPFDQAKAIKMLSKRGMSLSQIALKLGVSQTDIHSKLQLLRLDERLCDRITAAKLTEEHALALLRIPKEGRPHTLDKIISEGLTAKQSEDYIFSVLNPPLNCEQVHQEKPRDKAVKKTAVGDMRLFSNSISKLVDTLKNSGIKVTFKKQENDNYTEFKIRIKKETTRENEFVQLEICR